MGIETNLAKSPVVSEPVIEVMAFFFKQEVGKETFPKGTNLDHIMTKMVQKYGQVSSFVVVVPPVIQTKEID